MLGRIDTRINYTAITRDSNEELYMKICKNCEWKEIKFIFLVVMHLNNIWKKVKEQLKIFFVAGSLKTLNKFGQFPIKAS